MSSETFVYFIRGQNTGMVKIGLAKHPRQRLGDLQVGCTERLELIAAIPGDQDLEHAMHVRFAALRSHGEWFHGQDDLLQFINAMKKWKRQESGEQFVLDPNRPKDAIGRISARQKRKYREKRTRIASLIQAEADKAGMTAHDWVERVALPRIVGMAESDTSPSD